MDINKAGDRAKLGDKRAMSFLYKTFCGQVHFLCRMLIGEENADAATEKIFAEVWADIVATHTGSKSFEKNIFGKTVKFCKSFDPGKIGSSGYENAAKNSSENEKILASLASLQQKHKIPLLLSFIAVLPTKEVGEICGMGEGAVLSSVKAGRESVKLFLSEISENADGQEAQRFLAEMPSVIRGAAAAETVSQSTNDSAYAEIAAKSLKQKMPMSYKIAIFACLAAVLCVGLYYGIGMYKQANRELHHAEIDVEGYGTISVELDSDVAPETVKNFIDLANSGFYNGLTFHRIVSGFVIQGGDPQGTGSGGSENKIKGEFSENGFKNNISHVRGTISMARTSGDYDSASSQFFIVHKDALSLDGKYAGFGHVTDGMDIVDAICENVPAEDTAGTVLAENQPVIKEIRIID